MTIFSISAYNIKTAMVVYFTQYYLGDASVLPYVNFIAIGASIIGIVSMPALVARFGKKRTAIGGFLLAGVADGLNFLLPSTTVGLHGPAGAVVHRRGHPQRHHLGAWCPT